MREVAALAKVHLHVHLESTVRRATLAELAAANGVVVPGRPAVFDGFRAFADHNALVRRCLCTPEDFRRVAVEFCRDEAAQGTRYAEVTLSAVSHGQRLGGAEPLLEAVLDGLAQGRAECGVEVGVLLDHSRRRSVARAWRTLALARRYGLAGMGLAGEESFPVAPFAAVCDAAHAAGVALVHHAGECCGAASVREAVMVGRARRLGHGFRVLEDPAVVALVADRGIALEVCPSSNVALGLVGSYAEHPLPALLAAGLAVAVSTDIPDVTGLSLTDELERARSVFGWDDAVLAALNRTAIDASFAPESTKRELRAATDSWLATGR